LTYSVIMLNVDQHSPALNEKTARMKMNTYIHNLRNLNDNKDFPLDLLVDIYQSVSSNEIKIHKEHYLRTLTDSTWNSLYNRAKNEGKITYIQTKDCTSYYDGLIFNILWGRVITATKSIFLSSKSLDITEQSLANFEIIANVAAHYAHTDAMDKLIITLCELSSILSLPAEKFGITFGASEKAQMITKLLFGICQKHGDHIRESWKNISGCLIKLNHLILLPSLVSLKDTFTFPEENIGNSILILYYC